MRAYIASVMILAAGLTTACYTTLSSSGDTSYYDGFREDDTAVVDTDSSSYSTDSGGETTNDYFNYYDPYEYYRFRYYPYDDAWNWRSPYYRRHRTNGWYFSLSYDYYTSPYYTGYYDPFRYDSFYWGWYDYSYYDPYDYYFGNPYAYNYYSPYYYRDGYFTRSTDRTPGELNPREIGRMRPRSGGGVSFPNPVPVTAPAAKTIPSSGTTTGTPIGTVPVTRIKTVVPPKSDKGKSPRLKSKKSSVSDSDGKKKDYSPRKPEVRNTRKLSNNSSKKESVRKSATQPRIKSTPAPKSQPPRSTPPGSKPSKKSSSSKKEDDG